MKRNEGLFDRLPINERAGVHPYTPIMRNRIWTGRMQMQIVGPSLRGAPHLGTAQIKQRRLVK